MTNVMRVVGSTEGRSDGERIGRLSNGSRFKLQSAWNKGLKTSNCNSNYSIILLTCD